VNNGYRPEVDDFLPRKSWQQLSLREAGEFDRRTGQKEKLTGWGKIAKARAKK
jgi:hypothetical protein